MPDLTNALSQWLLSQLEMMPTSFLRQGAERLTPSRLLDRVLGEREAEELRVLLSRPPRDEPRVATVVMPGIMGSLLASVRGIGAMLWLNAEVLANGHVNLLDLDETGEADSSPDVEIHPVGLEKITYLRLVVTLGRETRLYEFPYDWRRRLEWNADLLHASLQRWSMTDPGRRFVLVGHSMGGMLARTYMARYPREAEEKIERVIMLGSPLRGAAVTALVYWGATQPMRVVARLHPDNDVVRFAAGLPSTYQLLPPPPDLWDAPRPYPLAWDPYDAAAWGLGIVRQDYLDGASRLHRMLAASHPDVEMFEIAGCHQRTVTDVRLPATDPEADPLTCEPVETEVGPDSGDEMVPLWSVTHPDVRTCYVQEKHNSLPSNSRVLEALLALVRGEPCPLPDTLPEPVGLLESLRLTPLMQQVAELRGRLQEGRLSRDDLAKMLFLR